MTLAYARALAEVLVDLLRPACQRIEIAGSIRRQKPNPNDIEVVTIPRFALPEQLVMEDPGCRAGTIALDERVNELNEQCDWLFRQGILEKRPDTHGRYCWGTGIKRAVFFQGNDYAPVDLFQVIAPVQWGLIYAIRTGPSDFNHLLVTSRWFGGACPKGRKVAGGRVWDMGRLSPDQQRELAAIPAPKFARLAEAGRLPVEMIPTPTEESFFAALGVPCWPPEQRTRAHIRACLQRMKG